MGLFLQNTDTGINAAVAHVTTTGTSGACSFSVTGKNQGICFENRKGDVANNVLVSQTTPLYTATIHNANVFTTLNFEASFIWGCFDEEVNLTTHPFCTDARNVCAFQAPGIPHQTANRTATLTTNFAFFGADCSRLSGGLPLCWDGSSPMGSPPACDGDVDACYDYSTVCPA